MGEIKHMVTKIHVVHTLLFISLLTSSIQCFSDLKEVRKEPFKDRIGSYAKYLRTPSETSLKPVRLNTKNSIQLTKKNTKLKRQDMPQKQEIYAGEIKPWIKPQDTEDRHKITIMKV